MRRHKSHAAGGLCKRGHDMTWAKVEALVAPVAAAKAPRPGDVRIVFYRDANAWCPHCHKVWFALEQKGLRYETVRVHLRGDPREPPKPAAYVDLVPSGAVPAGHAATQPPAHAYGVAPFASHAVHADGPAPSHSAHEPSHASHAPSVLRNSADGHAFRHAPPRSAG